MKLEINSNPFCNSGHFEDKKINLAVTGSVACYKAVDLLRAFHKIGIGVTVVLSAGAKQFLTPLLFKSLGATHVYGEMFSADEDVFAHLEPGMDMDAMLVAPASADALAKIASGMASEMFSAQALAFAGPMIAAPAMNPRMWNNAATKANVAALVDRGWAIIGPGKGDTACGEEGTGRLAELPEIFLATLKALSPQDMADLKVMVTLGPTRELWDGMRFWSNPSSGKMGAALATCAWLRGAEVTAICGPGVEIYLPSAIKRVDVMTADEMLAAAKGVWSGMDMGMFAAAVSDFAPERPQGSDNVKIKKTENSGGLDIHFSKNPDILKTLSGGKRPGQKTLGFAAEITPDMPSLSPLANAKLKAKNAHIIAANRVNRGEGAFGTAMSSMLVVDKDGHEEIWEAMDKSDIAWELCSWLLKI